MNRSRAKLAAYAAPAAIRKALKFRQRGWCCRIQLTIAKRVIPPTLTIATNSTNANKDSVPAESDFVRYFREVFRPGRSLAHCCVNQICS